MTREIIFRGKRLNNGEWMKGNLFVKGSRCTITDDCSCYSVDPETVGQWTGLTDRAGQHIFEDDIVKTPLLDPIFGDIISDAFCEAEIKFNNSAFVVSYYKSSHNIYLQDLHNRIEVVGNIHDNPELLKTE